MLAFCLHRRPYRESSMILEMFTRDEGRLSVLAKGVKGRSGRNSGKSAGKASVEAELQPFRLLDLDYRGKSELKNLSRCEQVQHFDLQGNYLYAGFYLNELLLRLLPQALEMEPVFSLYRGVLALLSGQSHLQKSYLENCLRCFELQLLDLLGYGVAFIEIDEQGHYVSDNFDNSSTYEYQAGNGFIKIKKQARGEVMHQAHHYFSGEQIQQLVLASETACTLDNTTLSAAKKLVRLTLEPLLEGRPLQSRQLFQ